MSTASCLIAKLSHYTDLSEQDRDLVSAFEKDERELDGGVGIHVAGEPVLTNL